MESPTVRRTVVGIGNEDRGDDAAGLLVARRLVGLGDVAVRECGGGLTDLLELLSGAECALLVDAAAGLPAGALQRFDAADGPLPAHLAASSTHGMGVPQAIELARALGRLPPTCVVYAIGAGAFTAGEPLSPAVARAVGEAEQRIRHELASWEATPRHA